MLKTLNTKSAKLRKGRVGVGGGSRAGCDRSKIDDNEVKGDEVEDDKVKKKVQKISKSKNLSKSKKIIRFSDFLTFGAKLAFIKLRQAFFRTPILYHFNLECHIRIEIDVSEYAMNGVFCQLILDDLGQWHPVVFFS